MRKLTKLQRYTVYCIMLEEAQSKNPLEGYFFSSTFPSTHSGFCLMCEIVFDYYYLYKKNLPELYSKGKKNFYEYHFNNWKERIAALKQCIKETEPK